jgi:hypothetical protein
MLVVDSKALIPLDYGVRGPGGGRGSMPVTPDDSAGAPCQVEQKWGLRPCHRRGGRCPGHRPVERPSAN